DAQKNTLYLAVNQVILGAMPLESYKKFHTDAIPSEQEIAILKKYLLQISPTKISDSAVVNNANEKFTKWMNGNITFNNKVQPAANGIEFINGFQQWKVIAITDRFDNNSLRVIYGNDIAVNAIKSGNINPWPDGTIFAKAAWKSVVDKDENVSPGEFWQVEFMIKDQKKYASTDSWGWARWRGTDLKPYGAKASFTTECMNCHQPMKDNDFVFTLPFQLKNQQILK
ncbi:MAG: cytochrome P460, partial [Pseudopedobacter saltans]